MKKKQLQSLVREELDNLLQEIDPSAWRTSGDPGGAAVSTALAITGRAKEAAEVNIGMQKATMKLIDTYVMDITYAKAIVVALLDVAQVIPFLMAGPVYGIRYKPDEFSDEYRHMSLSGTSRVGRRAHRAIKSRSPEEIEMCRDPTIDLTPAQRDKCINFKKYQNMVHKKEGELEFYYIWDVIVENWALFKQLLSAGEYGTAALIGIFLVLDSLMVIFWFLKIFRGASKAATKLAKESLKIKSKMNQTATKLRTALENSGNKTLVAQAKKIQARQAKLPN